VEADALAALQPEQVDSFRRMLVHLIEDSGSCL
jgi:hypothetical protein